MLFFATIMSNILISTPKCVEFDEDIFTTDTENPSAMPNSTSTDSDRIACEISIQKRVVENHRNMVEKLYVTVTSLLLPSTTSYTTVITHCIDITGSPRLFGITVITHELNGDRTNSENNRIMSGFCEYKTITLNRMSLQETGSIIEIKKKCFRFKSKTRMLKEN